MFSPSTDTKKRDSETNEATAIEEKKEASPEKKQKQDGTQEVESHKKVSSSGGVSNGNQDTPPTNDNAITASLPPAPPAADSKEKEESTYTPQTCGKEDVESTDPAALDSSKEYKEGPTVAPVPNTSKEMQEPSTTITPTTTTITNNMETLESTSTPSSDSQPKEELSVEEEKKEEEAESAVSEFFQKLFIRRGDTKLYLYPPSKEDEPQELAPQDYDKIAYSCSEIILAENNNTETYSTNNGKHITVMDLGRFLADFYKPGVEEEVVLFQGLARCESQEALTFSAVWGSP